MRLFFVVLLGFLPLAGAVAHEPAFPLSVLKSVVTVLPERTQPMRSTPGDLRSQERSGSGVAVRPGGYIATNAHVVAGARVVLVRLADGRELSAEIVGQDRATDLALLRIAEDLPVLPSGPEPALGAPVCGVGNPFGVGMSVTCGVVSAVRRSGMGFNPIEDFIQTDAVLNPGSSGGALVDLQGRLVGLVSAIFTRRSDANIGVNFAASAVLLDRVLEDLSAHGRVVRGQIGWRLAPLPRAERETTVGLRVVSLAPGGPAERAGLQEGDVATEIAGRRVRKVSEATTAVQLHRPGDTLAVTILRDGAPREMSVTIGR